MDPLREMFLLPRLFERFNQIIGEFAADIFEMRLSEF